MRKPVVKNKKHKARGVSLPPTLEAEGLKRAAAADLSFSRYVQRLIQADMRHNLVQPQPGVTA